MYPPGKLGGYIRLLIGYPVDYGGKGFRGRMIFRL